jgi:hypothetical protein
MSELENICQYNANKPPGQENGKLPKLRVTETVEPSSETGSETVAGEPDINLKVLCVAWNGMKEDY